MSNNPAIELVLRRNGLDAHYMDASARLTEKNKTGNNDENTNNSRSLHYAGNLSNSFIKDLEKVGKFYEKHKSYIKSKSKKNLEEV